MRSDVAVLFDLDGVLVDSRIHHLKAWQQFAERRQLDVPANYFEQTFGLRNDAILGGLLGDLGVRDVNRLGGEKEELFREIARGNLELLPGARELLAFLDEQAVPRAVVTSTPRPNVEMIVDSLAIAGCFQTSVTAEDTSKGKPDPEGFLLAAQRLGVAPENAVVIEDAPAGIDAAKAAGTRAVAVTTTHHAAGLAAADLVVDSLSEEAVRTFIVR